MHDVIGYIIKQLLSFLTKMNKISHTYSVIYLKLVGK